MDKEQQKVFEVVHTIHELLRKHPEAPVSQVEDEIWYLYRKFVLPQLEEAQEKAE